MAFHDAYEKILKKLGQEGVRYVVIGVFGINYYADDPGNMFLTQDCDVLIESTRTNVLAALKTLSAEGYSLESNGEPLSGIDSWLAGKIVEHRAVVTGKKDRILRIDLVLDGGKIPYREWFNNKMVFRAGKSKIYVGSLPQLIQAKENSNRDKDRKFLALYKIQLKEMLKTAELSGKGKKKRA